MTTTTSNNTNTSSITTTEVTTMTTQTPSFEMENDMQDLTLDFSSFSSSTTTLPTEITEALDFAFEVAKDKKLVTTSKRAESALSIIMAHYMMKQVGEDSFIGNIIFDTIVEQTYWWKNSPKEDQKTTHGKRIQDALIKVVGESSHSIRLFKEAVKFFKGYVVEKREEGKFLVQLNKDGSKTDIKEIKEGALNVSVTPYGLRVMVKYNTTITPIKGQKFVFGRNVQQTFGMNVINSQLETVMKSIRIHNEYSKFIDKEISDKKVTEYTKEAYKFNKEDALVLLLLLKENNIDIKELFENAKEGKDKVLVLSREEGLEGVKSLKRLSVPAYNFKEKYGKTGVVSTNDAKQGYVVPMVTLPRLVEFTKHNDQDVVITRENVNKTTSRVDKLNNADALWTRTLKVFVVADATYHTELNAATVGGNILVPNHIMLSDGACRVVNDMDQGGIKASYTPFQKLDPKMANGDVCVISSAGFKGGMLSALGLAYGDTNLVKNLFNIIDINTIEGAENFDPVLKQNHVEKTEAIIKKMQQAVLNRMVEIEIAGKMVTGVMVTVDVKITNAYSVDMMQIVEEEAEEFSGKKAVRESKEQIEAVLEEMDTNSRSSKGLRAYVAEQKKASADLFSVCEWIKDGLLNKTLKKKTLTTKVISQEIQTLAINEGKEVAMNFLDELLEQQCEQGFSVNKMYAFQLLGAMEKDIINTVDIKNIVHILQNSGKGLVEGSAVYSKTAMQDILDLIGTESYGWLTIEYPNGKVDVPMGSVLLGDTLAQMENEKSFVIAKGLLADILENCKTLVNSKGEYYANSSNHLIVEAFIQKPLLGKNFGYQFVKGYYGVALPMLGNYGVSTAGITNRNRMMKSDRTWEIMTLSKAPQYFKGMTASYYVVDLDFGSDMNLVLECAVFVNVEIVLMHQNDFDGDMYRITLGSSLPFVETIYNEFNGNFFKDFYESELKGNKFKMKKSQQCSLEAYHEAVYKAVLAKDHIGSYTANSYFYEAMLPNLIGKEFVDMSENTISITADLSYKLCALLKMLIQVEAMDNVKQEGSSTYITEMLFNYKLRNLKAYAGMSDEEVICNHLFETKKSIMLLVESVDMELTKEEVSEIVELAYHTSISFNKESTGVFNMFNARNIEEKNFNNIINFITTGEELDTMYNYNNSFDVLLDGADKESMYYEILLKTAQAIEACGKIRI